MGFRIPFLLFLGFAVIARLASAAEDPKTPSPGTPDSDAAPEKTARVSISQRTVPNPVTDEVALIYRSQLSGQGEAGMALLPASIVVHHEDEKLGYAWDPIDCRLLFAWHGDAATMDDLRFVAEGPAPFAATIGAWGPPNYFGYRLVDGAPEFLYYYGRLSVEERIRPLPGGEGFLQSWTIRQAEFGLQVTIPERWKPQVTASRGSWSGTTLDVPAAETIEVSLTWKWPDRPTLPELPDSWKTRLGAGANPKTPPSHEQEKSSEGEDAATKNQEKPETE